MKTTQNIEFNLKLKYVSYNLKIVFCIKALVVKGIKKLTLSIEKEFYAK